MLTDQHLLLFSSPNYFVFFLFHFISSLSLFLHAVRIFIIVFEVFWGMTEVLTRERSWKEVIASQKNSVLSTFHLLRISHIRNSVHRHSTFSEYLTSRILFVDVLPSSDISHSEFCPANVPPSPDISHPEFCSADIPSSPDISHLEFCRADVPPPPLFASLIGNLLFFNWIFESFFN